jgi:serine/threonine-protein kinase
VDDSPIGSTDFAGRYAIERELGRGATSTVYLALDGKTGRQVAIKVLKPDLAQSLGAQRFLHEIKLTSALKHRNIIPVLDSGDYRGQLYVVLPYMEGGTLRARLTKERQFEVGEAVAIAVALADALEYAHGKGVIHRDVKPENILFSGTSACLADFGIARALERAVNDPTTSTGVVRGTPAYMSPEQASGERVLDARTDVYSLGCVMYEMLAGMPAFSGPTSQSVIAQRMTHSPQPVRMYRPSVPVTLEQVMEKALMPAPPDRYRSAKAFGDAIAAAVGETASTTRASSSGTRYLRRHRSAIAVGILVVIVAATAAAASRSGFFATKPAGADSDVSGIRIAVAPFQALDPADSVWRHGFVDALSRLLDGAGPLRAVSPTTVVKQWSGHADDLTARALGARTGAELVVYGQLTRTGLMGRDTLRATAVLLDLKSTRPPREIEVRDDSAHIDRLIDSLGFRLLRVISETRRIGAVRQRASLGSHSMIAIKAFLQGEELLRRNEYARAETLYAQALQEDTAFALGLHRMRTVRRALGTEFDSLSLDYALRAGRHNTGLTVRDSLIILADTLAASLPRAPRSWLPWDADAQRRLKTRFAILQTAVASYPDDPEVWQELGGTLYFHGDRLGKTPEDALDAYTRGIDQDPGFGPPYLYAIQVGIGLRGTTWAQAMITRYLALKRNDERFLVAQRALSNAQQRRPSDAWLERIPTDSIARAAYLLRRQTDLPVVSDQLWRFIAGSKSATDSARRDARSWLTWDLSLHGRLKAADSMVTGADLQYIPLEALHLAEAGVISADSANRLFSRWGNDPDWRLLLVALPWWGQTGDVGSLARARTRFDALDRNAKSKAAERELGRYGAAAAAMYTQLIKRDTAGARRLALQLNDSLCTWFCAPQRLVTARLLIADGRPDAAARFLDAHPPSASRVTLTEIEWHLERARVASQIIGQRRSSESALAHEREVARSSYAFVANAWASADVKRLQDAVREAKQQLSMLGRQ